MARNGQGQKRRAQRPGPGGAAALRVAVWPCCKIDKKNNKPGPGPGPGCYSRPGQVVPAALLPRAASDHLGARWQTAAPGVLQVPGLTGLKGQEIERAAALFQDLKNMACFIFQGVTLQAIKTGPEAIRRAALVLFCLVVKGLIKARGQRCGLIKFLII